MDAKPFETLEAKINLVLERMKSVQKEKGDLQEQLAQWKTKYEEAIQQLEELTNERDTLRTNQRDLDQEEMIRSKITALLAKLEAA